MQDKNHDSPNVQLWSLVVATDSLCIHYGFSESMSSAHSDFSVVPLLLTSDRRYMFLPAFICLSVCLFVCLSVCNITQKVMDKF